MPACTYLNEHEFVQPVSDKEINETLELVRKATGCDWRVSEHVWTLKRIFRKPIESRSFSLYSRVNSAGEFQVINFYRPDLPADRELASLNFNNNAGLVVAYLYGILSGVHDIEDKYQKPVHDDELEEVLERAYWSFDARKKGYNEWKGRPQAERDAFKSTVRGVSALLTRIAS